MPADVVGLAQMLVWLHDTSFAAAVREGSSLFPWIESVHVLAVTLVVGSISIVDLRLLGIASTNRSIASVSSDILPMTWTAFVLAVGTGGALFTSHAVGYAQNLQFRMKLLLLVLAGLNMVSFHLIMGRSRDRWNESGATPWPGKVAGLTSLLLWIGIVAFGRWIGFAGVR
jgi:hypothetical protein